MTEELLEKKAWEVAVAPIQSVGCLVCRVNSSLQAMSRGTIHEVGMNLFMLWMSGSASACQNPGFSDVIVSA